MQRFYFSARNVWITVVIFLLTISTSCNSYKNSSDLRIEKNRDTVLIDETIVVKINLDNYNDSFCPAFFIIGKDDTARIPFDDSLKCGLFKGQFHKKGKKEFNGFVEYYDTIGKFKKEAFSFSFNVK